MNRIITVLLFLIVAISAKANISITSIDSTASICFNDGSLTVNTTGGSPPYSYAIINGPVVSNVTYPVIGGNINTFTNLHAGTYTVQIVDQSSDTLDVNVTVPGNYQFPIVTYTTYLDTLFASAALGKPPYKFALSSIGPDGPFGQYQSSNVFANLCNGVYYLRVLDSCQNFYTTAISISAPPIIFTAYCQPNVTGNSIYTNTIGGSPPYTFKLVSGSYSATNTTGVFQLPPSSVCPDTVYVTDICNNQAQMGVDCNPLFTSYCSNFSDSTATVTATGGTPPYVYTLFQTVGGILVPTATQNSGTFTHIPYNTITETIGFEVTDACGREIAPVHMTDAYMTFLNLAACPFNDTLNVHVSGAFIPGTITCLNCNPVQVQNIPNATFIIADTGTYILQAIDACGETRYDTAHVPNQPLQGHVQYTSCNSVQVTATTGTGTIITNGVVYVLYIYNTATNSYDSVTQNTTGTFIHSPTGNYKVMLVTTGCNPGVTGFTLPYFESYCTIPYYDNGCNLKLLVTYGTPLTDNPENYSLKSDSGVIYNEDPQGGGNGVYFSVAPGNYTLISDSGCSIPQSFPYEFTIASAITHSCLNQNTVTLNAQNTYYYYCNDIYFRYTLSNADTSFQGISDYEGAITFTGVPAGNYLAATYFDYDTILVADSLKPTVNAHCFLDTVTIRIPAHTEPIIHSGNVNVCGATTRGNIPFTITGGFPPYTVSIFGQSTTTTDSASGVLPGIEPDSTYTMRVSDSCGVSSTFSVSVIDTCNLSNCNFVKATFTVQDSSICLGQVIQFQNTFTSGTTYRWTANGILFSSAANPAYTATTAGNILFKCVVTYSTECKDSFTMNLQVDKPPVFNLGSDTVYCGNFVRVLSSGVYNTVWSTGITDSMITVSTPGTYSATLDNNCGNYMDSVTIAENPVPSVHLVADTAVCAGDSVTLDAYFPSATYVWSNGALTNSITILQSGTYTVTVTLLTCSVIDSTQFNAVTVIASQLLPADTVLCTGTTIVLAPNVGTNPVWQDGSHNATYTVDVAGTYSVAVNTICGDLSDTVQIGFDICASNLHVPGAFTPNGDGTNDYFTVFGENLAEYEIKIFNRWGEVVYDSRNVAELNNLSKGWDGTYKGKLQDPASFTYMINAKGYDGKDYFKTGYVILIR